TISAKPSVTITGKVTKSDGTTAIASAFVFAQKGPALLGFATTNASGVFSFVAPASTTGIQLIVNSMNDAFDLPAATFNSQATGTSDLGIIKAKVTATVSGKVTKSDGTTAIQGAFVFAQKGAAFLGASFAGTDATGSFSFKVPASTTGI